MSSVKNGANSGSYFIPLQSSEQNNRLGEGSLYVSIHQLIDYRMKKDKH